MFVVTKEELAPALDVIRAGLLKKSDLPIHSHVLMDVRSGRLRLATNSQVLHAESSLATKGPDVALAVPGEIAEIVDRLDGVISFEPREKTLTIKSGGTRLRLPCLDAVGFPQMAINGVSAECELPTASLLRALSFVEPAVTKQDSRVFLTGVLFQWKGGALTVVGSDGYVMGIARIPGDKLLDAECIIPDKAVNEIVRIIKSRATNAVRITISDRLVRFSVGSCEIISKLLDAKYPDWTAIVNGAAKATNATQISIPRDRFVDALNRISLIARDEKRFLLQYGQGRIVLSTTNGAQSAEEPVPAQTPGEGQIWLNKRQVHVALTRIAGPVINLCVGGAEKAMRLAGEERTECYIVMPMKE